MIFYDIEFFKSQDGRDLIYKTADCQYHVFTHEDYDLINYMYERIESDYPGAFKAAYGLYSKSPDFKFLIVRRFINCNLSVHDETNDIQADQRIKIEMVPCPIRCECPFESIICKPKFNTAISKREIEIVKLICSLSVEEIASRCFISVFTVENHIKNIRRKLNLHSKSEIVDWAHKSGLIK